MIKWIRKISSKHRILIPLLLVLALMCSACGTVEEESASSANEKATSVSESTEVTESPTPKPTATPTIISEPTQVPTPEPTPASGDMAVHFLDVGQGLAIYAQSGGQNLIYDGGDRDTSQFVV